MDLAIALRAFVRTVERGSVTAAARDLGVSQPAITKALRNLERHVGARLLERSTRAVRPTVQGQALFEASRSALATIDSALEGVRRDMGGVEGTLRVHAPSCLGEKHIHPLAMEFRRAHPGVTIDLILEMRNVDLVHENFDIAIRYGRIEGQDLVVRRLGFIRRLLAASPGFIDRVGGVESLEKLSEIPLVATPIVAPRDVLQLQYEGRSLDLPIRPALRTNNAAIICRTLLDGHAAGPVQHLLVAPHLDDGTLVRILPEYEVRPTEAFFAYPSVRYMRPVVRAFTDFMIPALRAIEGVDETAPRALHAAG